MTKTLFDFAEDYSTDYMVLWCSLQSRFALWRMSRECAFSTSSLDHLTKCPSKSLQLPNLL